LSVAAKMFEYTSLLVYTLFYMIVSACFILRTNEFVSNGLTVESLFDTVIDKEYNNFILHHIKRTSYSIIVHSSLPFGWCITLNLYYYIQYIIIKHNLKYVYNFSSKWVYFLVYLLGTLIVNDSEKAFVSVYFYELILLSLLPIIYRFSVVSKWKSNNWANHPLSIILSRYNSVDWTLIAQNISTEYQWYA